MLTQEARSALLDLVKRVYFAMTTTPPPRPFAHGIAYFDMERDRTITETSEFAEAVVALQADRAITAAYGIDNVHRLTIQFVYNTINLISDNANLSVAFDTTWTAFATETANPTWRFAAVANLFNFTYDGDAADLGHGVSIRGRAFDWLRSELRWDEDDLDRLTADWMVGGGSPFILFVDTSEPKTAENLLLPSKGEVYTLTARALLALRLNGPGNLAVGQSVINRPADFKVGLIGRSLLGRAVWRPGVAYGLNDTILPKIREQMDILGAVDNGLQGDGRHIAVALRSFSTTYDRLFGQTEDSVIDLITALEALLGAGSELSFKLAYRTASLIGVTDDSRAEIFQTMRSYYSLRSRIVHGSILDAKERDLVHKFETLREIARITLRGFIRLLANPGEWSVSRLRKDSDQLDVVLLQGEGRAALQRAMGILPGSPT